MLRSKGKYKYVRYNGLPIRYAGGKSLGVGHIVEHIPADIDKLASPFIGGGSLEIACAKELGMRVKAYDIFDILVNYWQVQLKSANELANNLKNGNRLKRNTKKLRPFSKDIGLGKHRFLIR